MAPSRRDQKFNTTATQRQGRNARKALDEEVDEECQTDCMGSNEGAEDDDTGPSQDNTVQNMIIGSLSSVRQYSLTHALLR